MKFHENISNGFQVMERTRFCDRSQTVFKLRSGQGFVTDRQTTNANGKNNTSPSPFVGGGGGGVNIIVLEVRFRNIKSKRRSRSELALFWPDKKSVNQQ